MSLLKFKDAIITNKPFFNQHVKNKQEGSEKPVQMSRNEDYTANLLDYLCNLKLQLIGVYLSRQKNKAIL